MSEGWLWIDLCINREYRGPRVSFTILPRIRPGFIHRASSCCRAVSGKIFTNSQGLLMLLFL